MFVLFLAAAAVASPPQAPDQLARFERVCQQSYGYEVMLEDVRAGQPTDAEHSDALTRGRFERALEANGLVGISAGERASLKLLCNFYLRGTEHAITGVARDYGAK